MPIGAILTGAALVGKAGLGAYQLIKAKQLGKQKRPEYRIPPSATRAINLLEAQALQTPEQAVAQMQGRLGATTAGGLQAIGEAGGSSQERLAAVGGLYGQQANLLGGLYTQAEQQKRQAQLNLASGLGRQAGYELQAQQYNILTPYEEAMKAKSALIGGGLQNISGALTDTASAGMAGMYGGSPTGLPTGGIGGGIPGAPGTYGITGTSPTTGFNFMGLPTGG